LPECFESPGLAAIGDSDGSSAVSTTAPSLARCVFRLAVLTASAAFGLQGFGRTLSRLSMLATGCSVAIALWRREFPLGNSLGCWDEAVAYALLGIARQQFV
jgi:hypothetical protein